MKEFMEPFLVLFGGLLVVALLSVILSTSPIPRACCRHCSVVGATHSRCDSADLRAHR